MKPDFTHTPFQIIMCLSMLFRLKLWKSAKSPEKLSGYAAQRLYRVRLIKVPLPKNLFKLPGAKSDFTVFELCA